MKRTSFVLVLSGIAFSIYFLLSSEPSVKVENIKPKNTVVATNYQPLQNFNNPKNISRDIAAKDNLKNQNYDFKKLESNENKIEIMFNQIQYKKNEDFKRLKNFYVIPKAEFRPNTYEVYEKRAAYYIVKSDFPVGNSDLAVVTVKGSKYLGIVTGVLKVELDDFSAKDKILAGHDYTITAEYEHLNRVFYQLNGLEESMAAYSAIKNLVPYAELEILQYERSER